MNKKIFWIIPVLATLTLTACTSISRITGTAPNSGLSAVELPTQTKLVLGTINLEETDYEVTAEQAAELLPMFYVLQELNDSSSAAQEEIDGLVDQIQGTLTTDQIQSIEEMSLSMKDVFALTQANSGASGSSNTSSTTGAGGGGGMGGPPDMGGMPVDGPGGMFGGGMPSTGSTSANSNTGSVLVVDSSTPSSLFDAAIELLKKKVQ